MFHRSRGSSRARFWCLAPTSAAARWELTRRPGQTYPTQPDRQHGRAAYAVCSSRHSRPGGLDANTATPVPPGEEADRAQRTAPVRDGGRAAVGSHQSCPGVTVDEAGEDHTCGRAPFRSPRRSLLILVEVAFRRGGYTSEISSERVRLKPASAADNVAALLHLCTGSATRRLAKVGGASRYRDETAGRWVLDLATPLEPGGLVEAPGCPTCDTLPTAESQSTRGQSC